MEANDNDYQNSAPLSYQLITFESFLKHLLQSNENKKDDTIIPEPHIDVKMECLAMMCEYVLTYKPNIKSK